LLKASEYVDRRAAVVKSWPRVLHQVLAALPAHRALYETPTATASRANADDTGEGRWTVDEAVRLAVPLNGITASLFARFAFAPG